MLRAHGVVGKFVEFFGPGMSDLPLADRATLANMAPEYGATCGFFPIDKATIDFLNFSARDKETVDLVEAYAKEQGLWAGENDEDPVFTSTLEIRYVNCSALYFGAKKGLKIKSSLVLELILLARTFVRFLRFLLGKPVRECL